MARDLDSPARRARARASRIREGIRSYVKTLAEVLAAWREDDWSHLGYASWEAYLDGEYGTERLGLSAELRTKAIEELRLAGMSQRAIAATVGVSESSMRRRDAAAAKDLQNGAADLLSSQAVDPQEPSVKGSINGLDIDPDVVAEPPQVEDPGSASPGPAGVGAPELLPVRAGGTHRTELAPDQVARADQGYAAALVELDVWLARTAERGYSGGVGWAVLTGSLRSQETAGMLAAALLAMAAPGGLEAI